MEIRDVTESIFLEMYYYVVMPPSVWNRLKRWKGRSQSDTSPLGSGAVIILGRINMESFLSTYSSLSALLQTAALPLHLESQYAMHRYKQLSGGHLSSMTAGKVHLLTVMTGKETMKKKTPRSAVTEKALV
jgi:hypothetical protein